MTYVLLKSENLPDIEAFTKLFDWFIYPNYAGKNIGKKVAIFNILLTDKGMKLTQEFEENIFDHLVNENATLKKENERLKAELQSQSSNKNLSINELLYKEIAALRIQDKRLEDIANILNERGFKNSRGNQLNTMQVSRLLKKYDPKD